jgi:hypothetical protein
VAEQERYEKPSLVVYGSLAEVTRANALTDAEDGIGKVIHTDGSSGIL